MHFGSLSSLSYITQADLSQYLASHYWCTGPCRCSSPLEANWQRKCQLWTMTPFLYLTKVNMYSNLAENYQFSSQHLCSGPWESKWQRFWSFSALLGKIAENEHLVPNPSTILREPVFPSGNEVWIQLGIHLNTSIRLERLRAVGLGREMCQIHVRTSENRGIGLFKQGCRVNLCAKCRSE